MRKKGLTKSETSSLVEYLDATDTHHSVLIQLLIVSGLRTHELFELRIRDLALDSGILTLRSPAKGSLQRQVALPKWFVSRARGKVLKSGLIGECRLVEALGYSSKGGKVQSFKAALRASWQVVKQRVFGGSFDLGLHCLRHTFTMGVFEATGRDIRTTQLVMGHKSISSTEKYLPYTSEEEIISVTRGLYENKY